MGTGTVRRSFRWTAVVESASVEGQNDNFYMYTDANWTVLENLKIIEILRCMHVRTCHRLATPYLTPSHSSTVSVNAPATDTTTTRVNGLCGSGRVVSSMFVFFASSTITQDVTKVLLSSNR